MFILAVLRPIFQRIRHSSAICPQDFARFALCGQCHLHSPRMQICPQRRGGSWTFSGEVSWREGETLALDWGMLTLESAAMLLHTLREGAIMTRAEQMSHQCNHPISLEVFHFSRVHNCRGGHMGSSNQPGPHSARVPDE